MHPDQHRLVVLRGWTVALSPNIALAERYMQILIHKRTVEVHHKLTVHGRQPYSNLFLYKALFLMTVFDYIGYCTDLYIMFFGKFLQLGELGHLSVGVHNLADDCRLAKAGHPGQVYGPLSVPRPYQHTT